jgi:hypothetical protein
VVEVGQQDDAFLFVGVGAGDDGDGAFRGARVVGQVGHVRRDVEEVCGPEQDVVLELMAVPHGAYSAEHVDRALVGCVLVGFGSAAGRDGKQLHVDGLGANRFRGDGRGIHEALFALEGFARADHPAGGLDAAGWLALALPLNISSRHGGKAPVG